MEKVLQFNKTANICIEKAQDRLSFGDEVGALDFLFSALRIDENNLQALENIAKIYGDMGLIELSNQYWYRYLDKSSSMKSAVAYENLTKNFYSVGDYILMSFYVRKMMNSEDYKTVETDEDFFDLLKDVVNPKESYHIAYPFDHADYSYKINGAKKAVDSGNFDIALMFFDNIPREVLNVYDYADLAYCLYMLKKDDEVINVCKESIKKFGDNALAYCTLCSLFKEKKDEDKSKYYYKKALSVASESEEDVVRMANCAMDMSDDKTAKKYIEKLLDNKSVKVSMRFYYALCLINLGKYKLAKKEISECRKINPLDDYYEFYSNLIDRLIEGDKNALIELPLKYEKRFPLKTENKYKRIINSITSGKYDLLNKKESIDAVKWGLKSDSVAIAKKSVGIISAVRFSDSRKILRSALISGDVLTETKRIIAFTLIIDGYKEKFGILNGDFFVKVKPRKLLCEGDKEGGIYLTAYALCVVKLAFFGIEDLDKIAFSVNKLYDKKFKGIDGYSVDEISAYILSESEVEMFGNIDEACKIFNVNKDRIKAMIDEMKEKENG